MKTLFVILVCIAMFTCGHRLNASTEYQRLGSIVVGVKTDTRQGLQKALDEKFPVGTDRVRIVSSLCECLRKISIESDEILSFTLKSGKLVLTFRNIYPDGSEKRIDIHLVLSSNQTVHSVLIDETIVSCSPQDRK